MEIGSTEDTRNCTGKLSGGGGGKQMKTTHS